MAMNGAAFADRRDAGQRLGAALAAERDGAPIILGVPRGGVVVAAEVARALGAPIDVVVARKLGHPAQPELALGAVGEAGVLALNRSLAAALEVSDEYLQQESERLREEVRERLRAYRGERPPLNLKGRNVILVDDGAATGYTLRAAAEAVRAAEPARLVVAVPVAAPGALDLLRPLADLVVCLRTPVDFRAVGLHYADFRQTSDAEVEELLAAGNRQNSLAAAR